jgi:hypothetical protein
MKSSKRLKITAGSVGCVGELGFVGSGVEEYDDGVWFGGCGGGLVVFEGVWVVGLSSILTQETLRDFPGLRLGAVFGDLVGNVERKEEDKASITV